MQRAQCFGIADQLRQLFLNVLHALQPVVLGHQHRRAHQAVDQRQLIGDGREAVELDEGLGQFAREFPLAFEETRGRAEPARRRTP